MRIADFLDESFGGPEFDVILYDHLVVANSFRAMVFAGDSWEYDFRPWDDLGEGGFVGGRWVEKVYYGGGGVGDVFFFGIVTESDGEVFMERPFSENSTNAIFFAVDVDFVCDHMGEESGGRKRFVRFGEDENPFVSANGGIPLLWRGLSSIGLSSLRQVDCR